MKKAARKKKESFFEQVAEEIKQDVQEVVDEPVKKKRFRIPTNRPVLVGAFVVLLIVIIAAIIYTTTTLKDAATPGGQLNAKEIEALKKEISDKIMVPDGETPTIATVTDIAKLESQPFFRLAQNGDKFVIYGSNRMAILYRPSIHKIVNVAPFNSNDANANTSSPSAQSTPPTTSTTPSVSPSPVAGQKLKVVVLNSTKEPGLAKKGAALLDTTVAEVTGTANAKGEYTTTTITKRSASVADSAITKMMAQYSKVKSTVAALPKDETAPNDADVVIILGSDFSEAY